jgi:type II pantothenate kinase
MTRTRFRVEIGLDLGATLTKAVVVRRGAPLADAETFLFPAGDTGAIDVFFGRFRSPFVAATGAGARLFAARRAGEASVDLPDEFMAWGLGEECLLAGAPFVPSRPHLLVSLGTGTSILRVGNGATVARVGGTGLGGGTFRGLGRLLLGESDHDVLSALAAEGDRRRVDLLVRDLYREGEIPLPGDLTAANLGRISSLDPGDIAHAVVGLIGENVALLAGALARQGGTSPPLDVVYAGSTLRGNPALREVLDSVTALSGAAARFLPRGEFVGAVGAVASARRSRT